MTTEKNLYSKILQLFEKLLLHKYLGDLHYFKHSCDAGGSQSTKDLCFTYDLDLEIVMKKN